MLYYYTNFKNDIYTLNTVNKIFTLIITNIKHLKSSNSTD